MVAATGGGNGNDTAGGAGWHCNLTLQVNSPGDDTTIFQCQAMSGAGANGGDTTQRRARNGTLAIIITAATAPGDDLAIALQRQAMEVASGNGNDIVQSCGNVELIICVRPPGNDGAITLERHTMVATSGDGDDATHCARRYVRLPIDVRPPGDDFPIAFQRQTVNLAGRDGDHITQVRGDRELAEMIQAPALHVTGRYSLGLGGLDQPQAEEQGQQKRHAAAVSVMLSHELLCLHCWFPLYFVFSVY